MAFNNLLTQAAFKIHSIINDDMHDRVYLDILITNIESLTTAPPPIAYYANRAIPILKRPSDYVMSIIRFSANTQTLPLFIPVIQPNQSDPNLTAYSVTLTWTSPLAVTYTQQTFIEWVTPSPFIPTPVPPSATPDGQQLTSDYYNAYNYQTFIAQIETALVNCWTALNGLTGGLLGADNGAAPIITWDTSANIATIYANSFWYDTTADNTNLYPITIWFNTPLYELYASFPATNFGFNQPSGENYQIIVNSYFGANTLELPVTNPLYVATIVPQEFSTLESFDPITSLAFISNTLPVLAEQTSAPQIFNDSQLVTGNTDTNANFNLIITDIVADVYRPNVIYNPTAEYRRLTLLSDTPLSKLDFQVMYRNRLGAYIPMTLASGASCGVKILFERKLSLREKDNR